MKKIVKVKVYLSDGKVKSYLPAGRVVYLDSPDWDKRYFGADGVVKLEFVLGK